MTQNGGGGTMYYTLKDHQGSLAAAVHGSAVERLSYDPWGRRRNTTNFGYDNVSHTFDRGYTLHEHYDDFDLINMNGRLYDPILGRMLSPDVVIQDEQSSQAYNRYSYCFNNPLRFTDPSGYVVTIPPEFEKYYMPQYFDDFETYKLELEKLDAQNVSFNTEPSEGKSVTTLSWTIGKDSYQMIIVDHGLKDYEQMCENSCVAAALAAQELRLHGNPELTEMFFMSKTDNSCDNGLYTDQEMKYLISKSHVYDDQKYFYAEKNKKGNKYYEGYTISEMSKNNGVLFRFYDDPCDEHNNVAHVMNATRAIQFSINGIVKENEIQLWDSDFNKGKIGGYKSFLEFAKPLYYKMGYLKIK